MYEQPIISQSEPTLLTYSYYYFILRLDFGMGLKGLSKIIATAIMPIYTYLYLLKSADSYFILSNYILLHLLIYLPIRDLQRDENCDGKFYIHID